MFHKKNLNEYYSLAKKPCLLLINYADLSKITWFFQNLSFPTYKVMRQEFPSHRVIESAR